MSASTTAAPQQAPHIAKKSKKKKKSAKKVFRADLNAVRQVNPIEGTNYVIEYVLSEEKKFEVRRGHYRGILANPTYQVRSNKTNDLRDEFSGYCGQ
ncbi:hypothetical protein U1Q18_046610, partial [Sarracenia purpurea var. burkii]